MSNGYLPTTHIVSLVAERSLARTWPTIWSACRSNLSNGRRVLCSPRVTNGCACFIFVSRSFDSKASVPERDTQTVEAVGLASGSQNLGGHRSRCFACLSSIAGATRLWQTALYAIQYAFAYTGLPDTLKFPTVASSVALTHPRLYRWLNNG